MIIESREETRAYTLMGTERLDNIRYARPFQTRQWRRH